VGEKAMLHNLKTLYQWCNKHNPLVLERFKDLAQYCQDATKTNHNTGENSLYWYINKLRYSVTQKEIQDIYYYCLLEAVVYGEQYLYDDIFKFDIAKKYRYNVMKGKSWKPKENQSICQ
jgi:hypothetical protein